MKGIIWRLKRLEYEDVEKSTWPRGVGECVEFKKGATALENLIAIYLCVERNDKEDYLDSLVGRVIELNERFYRTKKIFIMPFAHLSNRIERPKRAKALLELLDEQLKLKGFETYRASFGTHKRVLFEKPGQPGAVSYFEFPYSGEKPIF